MITERIMPIAMFLLFLMIGINGFIVVAGDLQDTNGLPISQSFNLNKINQLSDDIKNSSENIEYNPSGTDQPTSNTSAGFSIFDVTTWWGGVTNAVSNIIGIKGVYMINNAIFGIENYMTIFSNLFPSFSPIFFSITVLCYAIKFVVLAYAGSILVRYVVGRGIF